MATTRLEQNARRRLDIALRCIAAIVGAYLLAAVWAATLARLLPLERSEAVTAAALSSFVVYCALALWAFAARSVALLFHTLLVASVVLTSALALSLYLGDAP